jgi:proline utilization trans-activator
VRKDGDDGPCDACLKANVRCLSTFPRKQRIYGSIEGLSDRINALEELISIVIPNISIDHLDTEDVVRLSCNFKETVANGRVDEHAVKSIQLILRDSSETAPRREAAHQKEARVDQAFSRRSTASGKLLQNAQGRLHYFGPSSSLTFVTKIRDLVSSERDVLGTAAQNLFAGDYRSRGVEVGTAQDSESSTKPADIRAETSSASAQGDRSARAALAASVLAHLPSPGVADSLVEAFFSHVHPNFFLFHRASFQADYEALYSGGTNANARIESECDIGWTVCLCMVLVFGCQIRHRSPDDQRPPSSYTKLRRKLFSLAQSCLPQLVYASTLDNVRALLLIALYLHAINERNASWTLVGCATRIAIAIGLHRKGAVPFGTSPLVSPLERELRKRVWWTLYNFEQLTCTLLGRPTAVDEAEVDQELPSESILDDGQYRPPGLLERLVSLSNILVAVRKHQTDPWADGLDGFDDLALMEQTHADLGGLESWSAELPRHLKYSAGQSSLHSSHLRQVLLLHLQHKFVISLLLRPFLLKSVKIDLARKHGRPFIPLDETGQRLSIACVTNAINSAAIVRDLWTNGLFDGVTWFDTCFAYQSAMHLCLSLLPRSAEDNGVTTTAPDDDLDGGLYPERTAVKTILDVLKSVRLCSTMARLVQVAVDFARVVGIEQDGAVSTSGGERTMAGTDHHPTIHSMDTSYIRAAAAATSTGTALHPFSATPEAIVPTARAGGGDDGSPPTFKDWMLELSPSNAPNFFSDFGTLFGDLLSGSGTLGNPDLIQIDDVGLAAFLGDTS